MTQLPTPPLFGSITVTEIKEAFTPEQMARLMEHALAWACHDGNAFEGLIEQYLPEAYNNLWNGGSLNDFPNLYPCNNSDHWYMQMDEKDRHPQYDNMPEMRRKVLGEQFEAFKNRHMKD